MTSPNYVTLVLNEYDAAGNPVIRGTATLTPNSSLVDVTDQMDITPYVPQVTFRPGSLPQVKLLATDNANVAPSGWSWTLTFSGVPGNPPARSFYLAHSERGDAVPVGADHRRPGGAADHPFEPGRRLGGHRGVPGRDC